MPSDRSPWRPSAWLSALLTAQHTPWPAGRSVRGAIVMAGPLLVGLAIGRVDDALWVSLAGLLLTIGEKQPAYRARFVRIAATAPPTALAFCLGCLASLPSGVIVAAMAAVAFVSGVLSGYSATLSAATMWVMLIGALALGTPGVQPVWRTMALFLLGTVLHLALLAVDAAVHRRRPQRDALVALLRALAEVSSASADGTGLGACRGRAIAAMNAFDAIAISARGRSGGPDGDYRRAARITRAADQVIARVLAPDADPERCAQASRRLARCADAVGAGGTLAPLPADGEVLIRVRMLEAALWDEQPPPDADAARRPLWRSPPSRPLLASAAQLTLCTAIAYALFLWLPLVWPSMSHGYWIPGTVALAMKPDLGSVFTRATLRVAGTAIGAVIGVAIGAAISQPQAIAVVFGLVGAALPWAVARSYMWQAIAITPLLMLLLSLSPGTSLDGIGIDRAINNAIGGAVVIVFGYLVWPSARHLRIAAPFAETMAALAGYLRASVQGDPDELSARRAAVYRSSAGLQTLLQRTLGEPPPAGAQAWAWIPVVAAAERIADRITGLATMLGPPPRADDVDALARELDELAAGSRTAREPPAAARTPRTPPRGGESENPQVRELADEIAHLRSMLTARPTHAYAG